MPTITAETSTIALIFTSANLTNTTGSEIGFRANYSAVQIIPCGETFYNRYGYIESPNYPNSYPNNAQCAWQIYVSPGALLELYFYTFDIESSMGCTKDSFAIHDGSDVDASNLIER